MIVEGLANEEDLELDVARCRMPMERFQEVCFFPSGGRGNWSEQRERKITLVPPILKDLEDSKRVQRQEGPSGLDFSYKSKKMTRTLIGI